jgi:hypothetical protein
MREQRGASRVLVGKPREKRPLGRPRYRWEENINMDVKEMARRMWTSLIWLRKEPVVGYCGRGKETSGSIKCGEFLDWLRNC